jgi:hypothetical protein
LAILVFSLLIAAAALWTTLTSSIGVLRAIPATLAFAAAAALRILTWRRSQPAVIEIGANGVQALARDGTTVACGPLTGYSQWGASLLVLAVGARRQRRALFVAADALSAESFRELAVRARSAVGR